MSNISHVGISVDFFDDIRIKQLQLRLGDDSAFCLIYFLLWDAKHDPKNGYDDIPPGAIEGIADWHGENGAFFKALCDFKILSRDTPYGNNLRVGIGGDMLDYTYN